MPLNGIEFVWEIFITFVILKSTFVLCHLMIGVPTLIMNLSVLGAEKAGLFRVFRRILTKTDAMTMPARVVAILVVFVPFVGPAIFALVKYTKEGPLWPLQVAVVWACFGMISIMLARFSMFSIQESD